VTYAPPGRTAQTGATAGMGAVAIFDETGVFQQMAAVGGPLAAPWGLALAPAGFGPFGGDLLVGNFSFAHSEINAFDANGNFIGTIPISTGGNMPGGLWALDFGTGGNNGSPDTLFFSDGINGERDGLFGAINVNVPATVGIVDMPAQESEPLLNAVFDHSEKRDFVYERVWRVGDLLLWDNRCSSHARTDFPASERRLMLRTTVKGTVRPY
jgi:Taurine catabolism dioxygenase TauD, TfdA family